SYRVSDPKRRSVNTTGLLFPFDQDILLTSPFYRDVGIGISQMAAESRRHMLHLYSSGHDLTEVQPSLFWSPQMRAVDSLLALDIFDVDLLTRAAEQYPVVCLDADYRLSNVSTIEFDNRSAVRMAFKYLVDTGHRRIGFVGRTTSMDPSITLRWEAYRQSFNWLNLPFDPDWVLEVRSVEHVRRTAHRWLALPPERRPTGLIVIDRFWQVVPVWLSAGIKIPQQVSLVNIGVLELWSDYLQFAWRSFSDDFRTVTATGLHPPFTNYPPELAVMQPTTVFMPARAMGRWGMAEVIRRLADPEALPCRHVLPSEMIVGNTTAPLSPEG
ncbi:MAG: substrate-binding domain-containing protein, partial [Phycisphaerae bacterium]|nr:substrate-binding domain-containing protein [Phycisphaerae bacterium]